MKALDTAHVAELDSASFQFWGRRYAEKCKYAENVITPKYD